MKEEEEEEEEEEETEEKKKWKKKRGIMTFFLRRLAGFMVIRPSYVELKLGCCPGSCDKTTHPHSLPPILS